MPVAPGEENPSNGAITEIAAFVDSSLEAAVRLALGKPEGVLTEEDLLLSTKLEARDAGIADLCK